MSTRGTVGRASTIPHIHTRVRAQAQVQVQNNIAARPRTRLVETAEEPRPLPLSWAIRSFFFLESTALLTVTFFRVSLAESRRLFWSLRLMTGYDSVAIGIKISTAVGWRHLISIVLGLKPRLHADRSTHYKSSTIVLQLCMYV